MVKLKYSVEQLETIIFVMPYNVARQHHLGVVELYQSKLFRTKRHFIEHVQSLSKVELILHNLAEED